jgi:hypothetical protein
MQKQAAADDRATTATLEAPPKRTFGEKGDAVFPILEAGYDARSVNLMVAGISVDHETSVDPAGARQNALSFRFAPGVDVFVLRHFSIGGSLLVSLERTNTLGSEVEPGYDYETLTLGIAPRIGYAFPLSAHLTFWPHLGFAARGAASLEGPPLTATPYGIDLTADAQLAYTIDRRIYVSLAPKFILGGGPQLNHDPSSFEVGLSTVLAAGFVL